VMRTRLVAGNETPRRSLAEFLSRSILKLTLSHDCQPRGRFGFFIAVMCRADRSPVGRINIVAPVVRFSSATFC
jgi:hypothetical protein